MYLWVGLGNPGKEYARTLHNIGVFSIQNLLGTKATILNKKITSLILQQDVLPNTIVIFPQTYMNDSGRAVSSALRYFNVNISDVVVFHDEIEIPANNIRYKFSNGHAGHNGLRSIIDMIHSKDFHRIRIGVGRSTNPLEKVSDFLLKPRANLEPYVDIKTLASILSEKNLYQLS